MGGASPTRPVIESRRSTSSPAPAPLGAHPARSTYSSLSASSSGGLASPLVPHLTGREGRHLGQRRRGRPTVRHPDGLVAFDVHPRPGRGGAHRDARHALLRGEKRRRREPIERELRGRASRRAGGSRRRGWSSGGVAPARWWGSAGFVPRGDRGRRRRHPSARGDRRLSDPSRSAARSDPATIDRGRVEGGDAGERGVPASPPPVPAARETPVERSRRRWAISA